jgi:hypothetical protein
MSKTVTSENILKLRELTEKICESSPHNNEANVVLKELKTVVEEGETEVLHLSTPASKLKCYERMCDKINNIFKSIKQ